LAAATTAVRGVATGAFALLAAWLLLARRRAA